MSRESDLYDAHQRDRWLRPDAERWVRPDAARFFLPGTDLADVIPALARKRDRERAAEAKTIARELKWLAALRDELMEVKAELARRRREDEAKYSPSQPRVPAGNPHGGQWTDRSGGQGGGGFGGFASGEGDASAEGAGLSQDADLTLPMGNVDIGDVSESSELGDLFKIKPDKTRAEGVQLAAGGYPVDLLEERELGGHAIERHVTSRQSVVNNVRDGIDYARRNGDSTGDMRESSFTSLEAANKLVNSTISENPDQVNRVVSGLSPKEILHKEFETPTGFEAYAKNESSSIILSDTYAVRVVIVPDGRVAKGFRVDTAFPTNLRR
jgi:hypothetical protein